MPCDLNNAPRNKFRNLRRNIYLMFHSLHSNLPSPDKFTYPFCYTPDPLCVLAAHDLQQFIAESHLMSTERGGGKMFGVLVVEREGTDGAVERGYLAAYSGLLGGRNDWAYFVPPVFDAQQPDGYFKQTERAISALNHEISRLKTAPSYLNLVALRQQSLADWQASIDAFRAKVDAAKAQRDAIRKSGAPISTEQQTAMTRESQYMKAELRRRRKAMEQCIADFDQRITREYAAPIAALQQKRKQMSDALQRWLFAQYRVLNALGAERCLIDIFADAIHALPPAGAGDCCAPKLLQYAYRHALRPICMAEFWYGASPVSEIRHHLQYYPACRSKCLPILTFMLKGLTVEPNPLEQSTATAKPRVLYADDDIVVVDKPAGMLSVKGKGDAAPMSVEEYFAGHSECHIQSAESIKPVHRLDQSTSGILVLARTAQAYTELQRQFASRETMKRYEAVLGGVPTVAHEGVVSLPLIADIADRPRQRVDFENGKSAVTLYNIIKVEAERTYINLFPKTGRTHQLRVHCAHPKGLNCPILGDPLYGKQRADRMYLHAAELRFRHPTTGKTMHFVVPSGFRL